VKPEAKVLVNGQQASEATGRFSKSYAPGTYDVLLERDGYRSALATIDLKSGEAIERSVTLKPVRKHAWLGLAIPATLLAAATGVAAIVTFYAADGQPLGPDFQTQKNANAAMQGLFYPSLALAAVGYIVYAVKNKGRIADGAPLRF